MKTITSLLNIIFIFLSGTFVLAQKLETKPDIQEVVPEIVVPQVIIPDPPPAL